MAKPTKARGSKAPKKSKSTKPKGKAVRAPARAPKKAAKASRPKAKAPAARPKAAKAKRTASKGTRVEASAMPEHAANVEAARRAVARPTKMHHEAQMERAEHDHQDPRLAGIPGVSPEGDKVQVQNFGQFKNKAAGRLDKPTNWFRRAAKPKS